VRVILASGRGHREMIECSQTLGLQDFLVSAQGALVQHLADGTVIYERPLQVELAKAVTDDGIHRGLTVFSFARDTIHAHRGEYWPDWFNAAVARGAVVIDTPDNLAAMAPLKVIWAITPDSLDEVARQADAKFATQPLATCITSSYSLEFTAPEANKAAGVRAVAEHYGIPTNQILAFGDGNNDVPMLEWAGLGVAMSQGTPAAHAAANLIAPAGDPETALARAIQQLLAAN
jgi:Cof subfamily protein (haloacid dehalogenase superfamily)